MPVPAEAAKRVGQPIGDMSRCKGYVAGSQKQQELEFDRGKQQYLKERLNAVILGGVLIGEGMLPGTN